MAKYFTNESEKGYIDDVAEIHSMQFNNMRHTVLGCMLGDFSETGEYVVHPNIVKELIEMPKYVVDVLGNIEICKSQIKLDKQISFLVIFEGNKATLSLIEKMNYEANNKLNSGTWSNVNEYILDEVETSGEINRSALYLKWNIQDFPGMVIDVFNCEPSVLEKYFGIVTKFKKNMEANSILLDKEEELEEVESEYFLNIFEILNSYPEFKKAVNKQIKTSFEEKKQAILLDKPNFVKTINEVMEKAIIDNINILSDNKKQEFLAHKRNAVVNATQKKQQLVEIENQKLTETTKVVTMAGINNITYKSITDIGAKTVVSTQKAQQNALEKAPNLLIGKGQNKKSVVEYILTIVDKKLIATEDTLKKVEEKQKVIAQSNKQQVEPIKKESLVPEKKETKKQETKIAAKKSNSPAKKPKNDKGSSAKKAPENKGTKKQEKKSNNNNDYDYDDYSNPESDKPETKTKEQPAGNLLRNNTSDKDKKPDTLVGKARGRRTKEESAKKKIDKNVEGAEHFSVPEQHIEEELAAAMNTNSNTGKKSENSVVSSIKVTKITIGVKTEDDKSEKVRNVRIVEETTQKDLGI